MIAWLSLASGFSSAVNGQATGNMANRHLIALGKNFINYVVAYNLSLLTNMFLNLQFLELDELRTSSL